MFHQVLSPHLHTIKNFPDFCCNFNDHITKFRIFLFYLQNQNSQERDQRPSSGCLNAMGHKRIQVLRNKDTWANDPGSKKPNIRHTI